MLLKLRGGLNSFFVTLLLGVLIAAFAIWGVGPGMLGSNTNNVAVVGDTTVPTKQYATNVQRRAQQLQQQFGGQISTDQIIGMMGLDMQVLNQMVTDAAVTEHMRELGLRATSDQIVEELHQLEAFITPDGKFSRPMLEQALIRAGLTEKELLEDIRRSVTRAQLLDSMTTGSIASRAEASALHTWLAERRRAEIINFAASDITDFEAPTEEELQKRYEAQKASYMTPYRRSYHYIALTPEQFADKVEITESDLEAAYENNLSDYVQPELRSLMLATFPDQDTAKQFVTDVNGGKDFSETAVALTEFTAEELDLGDQSQADISADFGEMAAEHVFATDVNALAGPFEGVAGWQVFKVTSVTKGETRTMDDVRAELTEKLTTEHAIDKMFDILPDVEDTLAETGSLDSVAEKHGLILATVTKVDERGQDENGKQIITQKNEFFVLRDAFQQEVGQEAILKDLDPSDTTAGSYFLEVTDVIDPQQKSFEDVKAEVRAAIETERKQAKAGELAEKAKEQLLAGGESESIATELGGTSFTAKNVARKGGDESSLSPNIRNLIFELAKGDVDTESAADGNGYVVVRVDDIIPGDPDGASIAVDQLEQKLKEDMAGELMIQYQKYLMDRFEPQVNTALARKVFERGDAQ